jgi:hypothetical protein
MFAFGTELLRSAIGSLQKVRISGHELPRFFLQNECEKAMVVAIVRITPGFLVRFVIKLAAIYTLRLQLDNNS